MAREAFVAEEFSVAGMIVTSLWVIGQSVLDFVAREIRLGQFELEQVRSPSERKWAHGRAAAGASLEQVRDVLAAEGMEGEPVGDRAGSGLGAVDLGEGE